MLRTLFVMLSILVLTGGICYAQYIEIAAGPYHLGDDDVEGYVSAMSTEREFVFNVEQVPQECPAELIFDVRGIDLLKNKVMINDTDIGAIPTTPANKEFFKMRMFFNSSILNTGKNTLVIYARNEEGDDCRGRDDFEIKNIRLKLHTNKQLIWGKQIHLGDDEQPFSKRGVILHGKDFSCMFDLLPAEKLPRSIIAKLTLDIYDVNYNTNNIILNGVLLGSIPGYAHEKFITYSILFDAKILKETGNTLEIAGCGNEKGDDFQFRNITLEFVTP